MVVPKLPPELLACVNRYWGFPVLRPMQTRAIASVLANRDSLVVLPTGGGKSLCYQAPAAFRGGLTVVVSPLIALMKDQVDGLTRVGVPAVRLDSSLTAAAKTAAARDLRSGGVRLAFTSPERLVNTDVAELLRAAGADTVAVDEAHCVSHWGHDFRPEYRQLARVHDMFPGAAVHAYTATATEQVRADIAAQLCLRDPDIVVGNFDRPNLTFRVLPQVDLKKQLREVLDRHRNEAGIVYCLRRKDVDDLTAFLLAAGYNAAAYHAGLSPDERSKAQEDFISESVDVVVATIAFGMGIDRSNVRFVIHAAMPKSIEHYQQETGRAGRDGLPSECVLLFSGGDPIVLKQIIEKSALEGGAAPEYTAAALRHLDDMTRYARGARCRHAALVSYFGQEYEHANCAACDICLGDTDDVPDAATVAQKILSCVARVNQGFGITHVIDVLRGAMTESVKTRGHDKLTTHGLLREISKPDLRDWVYQLIGQEVLAQSPGEYPVLKLNAASWAVMRKERPVRLIRLARGPEGPATATAGRVASALPPGASPELFELLRQLRRQEAVRAGVPPYVVFPDTVLAELARHRPSTLEKMRFVSGIGEKKLKDYGPAFLKIILAHCEQTGMILNVPASGTGMVAATAPKPPAAGGSKAAAFAQFRSGAAVATVAKKQDVTPGTAWSYLAEFVALEKPAEIFPWVPEDVCERVAAAAEQDGSGRLKPVFLLLNEEVPYEHIRVVLAMLGAGK